MTPDEFDIETVPFVPGPSITNDELAVIALTLFKLANNSFKNDQHTSAWEIDSRTHYVAE